MVVKRSFILIFEVSKAILTATSSPFDCGKSSVDVEGIGESGGDIVVEFCESSNKACVCCLFPSVIEDGFKTKMKFK
jgi:hypothetical protein